jgi:hypothetical protein
LSAPDAPDRDERRAWLWAGLMVAVVTFAPFLRGIAAGSSFFFRDLSRYFFPMRLFALEGLRHGELRFWDPYDSEGIPLVVSWGYPLELLQALWPSPAGITFVMALHFPLAAIAFLVLARRLGLRPIAAGGGAIAYALGGFALSMINLYIYVHTLAWAPLVVWGLLRAAEGGRRALAWAALLCGIALSTTGLELVLQTLIVAAALGLRGRDVRRPLRMAAAVLLGLGLCAPVFAVLGGATVGTARSAGFVPDAVLNQSVHPFTFLQVVVADLYGRLANMTNDWWGIYFFEHGFPYVVSLYLGATTVVLAAAGLASRREHRRRLLAILAVATVVCLGRWGGWPALLDWIPASWRIFRFPTKAFFSIHLVVALLAAYGLDALCRTEARALRALIACGLGAGGLLTLAPALPALWPSGTAWFLAHFFPTSFRATSTAAALDHILGDAAVGGGLLLGVTLLAALAWTARLAGSRAALGAAAVIAADLLRTGAGLNPMIDVRLFRIAPEMRRLVDTLQPVRLHTCDPFKSTAYWTGRAVRPNRHVVFTFLVMRDSLFPHFSMHERVATALGEDLTGLVPLGRTASGLSCAAFDDMADRLREAAVTHVSSLEPLTSAHLQPVASFTSPAIDPAIVHVYALRDPLPRIALLGAAGSVRVLAERSDTLALEVTAAADAEVLVRDGYGSGWSATLGGRPVRILEHERRHRRVAVPAGTHRLEMRYRPPGLTFGLIVFFLSAAALLILFRPQGPP